jgi:hypothetical protein
LGGLVDHGWAKCHVLLASLAEGGDGWIQDFYSRFDSQGFVSGVGPIGSFDAQGGSASRAMVFEAFVTNELDKPPIGLAIP